MECLARFYWLAGCPRFVFTSFNDTPPFDAPFSKLLSYKLLLYLSSFVVLCCTAIVPVSWSLLEPIQKTKQKKKKKALAAFINLGIQLAQVVRIALVMLMRKSCHRRGCSGHPAKFPCQDWRASAASHGVRQRGKFGEPPDPTHHRGTLTPRHHPPVT